MDIGLEIVKLKSIEVGLDEMIQFKIGNTIIKSIELMT